MEQSQAQARARQRSSPNVETAGARSLARLGEGLWRAALAAVVALLVIDLAWAAAGALLFNRYLDYLGPPALFGRAYLRGLWALAVVALALVGWQLAVVATARWLGRRAAAIGDAGALAAAAALLAAPVAVALAVAALDGAGVRRAIGSSVWWRVAAGGLLVAAFGLAVWIWSRWLEPRLGGRRWPALALLCFVAALIAVDAAVLPGLYPFFHWTLGLGVLLSLQRLAWRRPPPPGWRRAPRALVLAVSALLLIAPPLALPSDQLAMERFLVVRFTRFSGKSQAVLGWLRDTVEPPRAPGWQPPVARERTAAALREVLVVPQDAPWPDLLLLSVDGLSPWRTTMEGYRRATTPFLAEFARTAAYFPRAYTPYPATMAALTALLSGEYAHERRPSVVRPPERLLARFRGLGYRVYCDLPLLEQLFGRLGADPARSCDLRLSLSQARWQADSLLSFLRHSRDRPVLAIVHFLATHRPYLAFDGIDFGDAPEDRYDAALRGTDGVLRRIVEGARRRGRDLRVVITGDHGHAGGWHGLVGHNTSLFEDQIRVPLLLHGFGIPAGRIERPVSLLDLTTTLARGAGVDLLAVAKPGWRRPATRPLLVYWENQAALIDGRFKLVLDRRQKTVELYDVVADPRETRNLAARQPRRADAMRRRLADRWPFR